MVAVNQKLMIKIAIAFIAVAVYTYTQKKTAEDAPQETLGAKLKSLKFGGKPLGAPLKSLKFGGKPLGAPLKSLKFGGKPLGRIIGSDEEPLPKWIWGIVVTLVMFKIFEKPLRNMVEK